MLSARPLALLPSHLVSIREWKLIWIEELIGEQPTLPSLSLKHLNKLLCIDRQRKREEEGKRDTLELACTGLLSYLLCTTVYKITHEQIVEYRRLHKSWTKIKPNQIWNRISSGKSSLSKTTSVFQSWTLMSQDSMIEFWFPKISKWIPQPLQDQKMCRFKVTNTISLTIPIHFLLSIWNRRVCFEWRANLLNSRRNYMWKKNKHTKDYLFSSFFFIILLYQIDMWHRISLAKACPKTSR